MYKFQKIVEKMSRDKRRVVVIDRKKYTEKCLNLLHTESFIQLGHDPIKAIERNVYTFIRTIRNNLTKQEFSRFSRLYLTGSSS